MKALKALSFIFGFYAVAAFIGGCCGAAHQFASAGLCLIVGAVLWGGSKEDKV